MASAEDRARITAAIARCYDDLDARGATAVGPLDARLRALIAAVEHPRVPRVTVVGRRGAGKSSLLNALANEQLALTGAVEDTTGSAKSYRFEIDDHIVEWIDTGGLRAGGAAAHRADMLVETLCNEPPDVIVFAHHASEVDAGIDAELEDLSRALDELRAQHGRDAPIIALATRVDELEPPEVMQPPFDHPEKLANISAAVRTLRGALARHKLHSVESLAINTWFSSSDDLRWNVNALRAALLAQLSIAPSDRALSEQQALLHRIADAFASVIVRAGTKLDDGERAWFVATLRRLGPIAARIGDRADLAARPNALASPAQWLTAGLGRAGARSIADAVALRSLRALGARVVDAMFDDLRSRGAQLNTK